MPRILFVTQYHYLRHTGGAELQCWMLAREFVRRGWDVHYVSENDRPDAPRELDGVALHYIPETAVRNGNNREECRRILRELNPDAVYNRVFNIYTSYAISLAPDNAVTIWAAAGQHDGEVSTTLGELWQTKSLKQFLVLVPRILRTRFLARKAALHANVQLAQSREQLERLTRQGFHPVLLRNSLANSADTALQKHVGKPLVLWVGSIKQWKRPELFIELAQRCADLECEFVMAGEFHDSKSQTVVERAGRELFNFRYAGFVPPEQIGKLYDKAHILVSTSRAEGFPNTFTQVWLRGVPVLSLDVDPDGLLSREGFGAVTSDTTGLEQKLRELIADPGLRRQIGLRASEFAKKEFDLQANVDRLENLIKKRLQTT